MSISILLFSTAPSALCSVQALCVSALSAQQQREAHHKEMLFVLLQILKEAISSVEGDPSVVAWQVGSGHTLHELSQPFFTRIALSGWQTTIRTCDPGPCPSASNPRPWHPRLVRPCVPGYARAFVTLAFGLATLCDPRPCDRRPCDPRSCDQRSFDPWPLTLGPATLDLVSLRPETLDLVSLDLVTLGFTRHGLVNLGLLSLGPVSFGIVTLGPVILDLSTLDFLSLGLATLNLLSLGHVTVDLALCDLVSLGLVTPYLFASPL